MKFSFRLATLFLLSLPTVLAAQTDWYCTQSMGIRQSWNTLSLWNSEPGGNGTTPQSIHPSDIFHANGSIIRPPTWRDRFAATLVLGKDGALLTRPRSETMIETVEVSGGIIALQDETLLDIGTLDFVIGRIIVNAGQSGLLQVGVLRGSGSVFDSKNTSQTGVRRWTIQDASEFSGEYRVVWGTHEFVNDVAFPKARLSFSLKGEGELILDSDLTVGALEFGGREYAPGTYDFDELNAAYDAKFVDGGTGSITVQ